jgi:hypothetical protein
MRTITDYDETVCILKNSHFVLPMASGNDMPKKWSPDGGRLTSMRTSPGLRSYRSTNKYFLDIAYNADVIPVAGGDPRKINLVGRE